MGPALLPFTFDLFGGRGTADKWRSEVNLAKMVISSHPVGSTVIKLGGKVTPPTEPPPCPMLLSAIWGSNYVRPLLPGLCPPFLLEQRMEVHFVPVWGLVSDSSTV